MMPARLGAVLASLVLGCGSPERHPVDGRSPESPVGVGSDPAAIAGGPGVKAAGGVDQVPVASSPASVAARGPLVVPVSAVTVRGALWVRRDAAGWEPLPAGASLAGVREIKAERRGAIVALGDAAAAPLVYLRAGSHIQLGQDPRAIHVAIIAGRIRIRHGGPVTTVIDTAGGDAAVDDDVMADAAARSPADVALTAAQPAAASWSLALDSAETTAGFGRLEARGPADRMDALELKTVKVEVW